MDNKTITIHLSERQAKLLIACLEARVEKLGLWKSESSLLSDDPNADAKFEQARNETVYLIGYIDSELMGPEILTMESVGC